MSVPAVGIVTISVVYVAVNVVLAACGHIAWAVFLASLAFINLITMPIRNVPQVSTCGAVSSSACQLQSLAALLTHSCSVEKFCCGRSTTLHEVVNVICSVTFRNRFESAIEQSVYSSSGLEKLQTKKYKRMEHCCCNNAISWSDAFDCPVDSNFGEQR